MIKRSQHFFDHIFPIFLVIASVLSGALSGCVNQGNQRNLSLVEPEKAYTIYAAGDIANCDNTNPADTNAAKTAAFILAGLARDKDAAALTLGDNAYMSGSPNEYSDCYAPTWGQFKERTFPSSGNHEYNTPGALGYFDYFGSAAAPERHGYYSVNLGQWHAISLNSNLKGDEMALQMTWLKQDLAEHKTRCTLAYWHYPVFSSGGHGNNDAMKKAWQTLQAADADVVLVGHDHDYERFAPQDSEGNLDDKNGIREFVVGTGGAKLTPILLHKANSEVSDNSTHGVLKLELKESGYAWEFLPVVKNGFTDRGAALCH